MTGFFKLIRPFNFPLATHREYPLISASVNLHADILSRQTAAFALARSGEAAKRRSGEAAKRRSGEAAKRVLIRAGFLS